MRNYLACMVLYVSANCSTLLHLYTDGLGMQQFWPLDDMGYPMPTMVLDGESVLPNLITFYSFAVALKKLFSMYLTPDDMILVNTFEETFGDIYPKGVWRELSNKASANIDRYVVALASFDGTVIYNNVPFCHIRYFISLLLVTDEITVHRIQKVFLVHRFFH